MKTCLSFGGGVNTMALLCLIGNGQWPRPDNIVMADTRSEKAATYTYLAEVVVPYCRAHELEITVLGSEWRSKHCALDLESYCLQHHTLPNTWMRWCTDKYKISPIARWRRAFMGATKLAPVESWIGIATDERRRAVPSRMQDEVKRYPLIELGLNRANCEQVIRDAGLPVPPKSGCWYCPFQKRSAWQAMKREEPMLFERALRMERNAQSKDGTKKYLPIFGSLEMIASQNELPGFDEVMEAEAECVTGSCFV